MINSSETTVVTKIPHGLLEHLYLYTLAIVDLSECPASFLQDLMYHRQLEVLAITWSSHQCTREAYRNALLSFIRELENLRSLTIHRGLGCSMDFLDSLSCPPRRP